MTNSIELMEERFASLPEDAQKAIKQFDYDLALKKIHTANKLHIDQAASLEQAVADVVFGDTRPQDLIGVINKELRIDHEKAKEIAFEVNSNILIPIQDLMKKIQSENTA